MSFEDLPDLALDGAAIACNDEFFAEKENLLKPHAAEWKDHLYTDRGKWMDGWETRRRRAPEFVGHPSPDGDRDWCVVRLGMPGRIRGVVVDTAYFRGNFPESCRILAAEIDSPLDLRALDSATWVEIAAGKLAGDSKNKFDITNEQRFTHVKLEIFPDGGVARLRVHGEVVAHIPPELVDLAALEHGAVVESCSDMFFGSRNNLIKPGPSRSMADGWETRRRRGPGNDWALIRLATTGTIDRLEIDTSHFKGNAPARCVVEAIVPRPVTGASSIAIELEDDWRTLLASPLQPHTKHVFASELRRIGPVSHLRLSVFPCGGIARLRAWGRVDGDRVRKFDEAAFLRCCGSTRWAKQMAAQTFEDLAAMLRIGERMWWSLSDTDQLEAFAAHPRIGDKAGDKGGGKWSAQEQGGTATAAESTLIALADANRAYFDQFGFIYIVCATGRSADAMLADITARLRNTRAVEVRTAAEEQAKILRLRLAKLVEEKA